MKNGFHIAAADVEAGLSASFGVVCILAIPEHQAMLGAMFEAGGTVREPVSLFVRGCGLFASVEFEGRPVLPVTLREPEGGWVR